MQGEIQGRSHVYLFAYGMNQQRMTKARYEKYGAMFGDASQVESVVHPAQFLNPVMSNQHKLSHLFNLLF